MDDIRLLCAADSIRWTGHAIKRIIQREISRSDVKYVLSNGEIIEQYPDDYPYPSCLILGVTPERRCLHVVCGIAGGDLWIISAYQPVPEKWTDNFRKFQKKEGSMIVNCFMCKGSLEDRLTTFMVDVGNCIVIVKNVPAQVCTQCSETSYADHVAGQLEKIVSEARKALSEITVVNYTAGVA